jgi:hypothetical protein
MSGNGSDPRRAGATRAAVLVLLGFLALGGAAWRLLRAPGDHRQALADTEPIAPVAQQVPAAPEERPSGSGAPILVQAPNVDRATAATDRTKPTPETRVRTPASIAAAPPVSGVAPEAARPAALPTGPRPPGGAVPVPAPAVASIPMQLATREPPGLARLPASTAPGASTVVAPAPAALPPPRPATTPAPPSRAEALQPPAGGAPAAAQAVAPGAPAVVAPALSAKTVAPTPKRLAELAPPTVAIQGAAVAPAAPPAPPAEIDKPSFDIVRIGPRGDAVVAGRAAPNADVRLLDNGHEIARARADESGQWVVLPDRPLPGGGQELTLAAREADKPEIAGDAPVILVVPTPDPAKRAEAADAGIAGVGAVSGGTPNAGPAERPTLPGPLAVLTPDDAAPRLLQAPAPAPTAAESAPEKTSGKVGLDVVDYDDHGAIRFAGTAAPGSLVRLYVDNKAVGDAAVDPQGRWGLMPGAGVAVGDHRLRVDDLDTQGEVTARVELPFERAQLAPEEVLQGHVVVQPRQSLWRIARREYGQGVRYTVIYEANREQIQDPSLIYPGQVFAIPALPGAIGPAASTGTPSSDSKSR